MSAETEDSVGQTLFDMDNAKPQKRRAPRPSRATECEMVFRLLADVLEGESRAEEFMRKLPGVVLTIPSVTEIEQLIAERRAAKAVAYDPSEARVAHLQGFYGMERKDVSSAFLKATGDSLKDHRAKAA